MKIGTSAKFQAVLFTDALLYCKVKGKDKLKYKGLLLLSTSSLNIGMFDKLKRLHNY